MNKKLIGFIIELGCVLTLGVIAISESVKNSKLEKKLIYRDIVHELDKANIELQDTYIKHLNKELEQKNSKKKRA